MTNSRGHPSRAGVIAQDMLNREDAYPPVESFALFRVGGRTAEDATADTFEPTSIDGPNGSKVVIRRRIFDILLKRHWYHRFGASQFSGMISVCFLGGRTPIVS